jgi:tRNA pseudouridine65 synthase
MQIEIIYKDNHLVAINKPHGLLVHRSKLAQDTDNFALQGLRDLLGRRVYPCHRIDRKTSGVLLFALDKITSRLMMEKFSKGQIQKKYLAIVRGYTSAKGFIDYPLTSESGSKQQAFTKYFTIEKLEIEQPFGKFPTSRYSLVEVDPLTGRMHQIRKHFAHIYHPIIGDRPYGCNKQNRLFKEIWNMTTMMLHAYQLEFIDDVSHKKISICAIPSEEFMNTCKLLGFEKIKNYFHQYKVDNIE